MHHVMFKQKPVAAAVNILLAISFGALATTTQISHAQNSAAESTAVSSARAYDIPAGSLTQTLNAFAHNAGVVLSFAPELSAGKTSAGIKGTYTVKQGFDALLHGSGLAIAPGTGNSYTLNKIPTSQVNPVEATLPAVSVKGSAQQEIAWGPVDGYVAKRSVTGTKMDIPLLETTKSISIITRDQMTDQSVQTVEQALRYTSGVDPEGSGYDLRRPWTSVRGFAGSYYRDGVKAASGDDNLGYFSWAAEPYGLERVEVLKGPSSILYGRGAPGGIINQVSKMPTEENIREIGVSVGSYNRYQTNFDIGGKVTEEGDLLFRVTGLARESKTQTDYSRDDRLYIAPSLTWRPSAATSLTVKAEYLQDRVTPKSFYPSNSLISFNPNGSIPISSFIGEPGFDRYDRDQSSISYLFKHQLNDNWSFNQNMHYGYSKIAYDHVFGTFWPNSSTVNRLAQNNDAQFHTLTIDSNLQGKIQTGPVTHELLFGADYQRSDMTIAQLQYSAPGINPFNPVYSGTTGFVQNADNTTMDESVQKGVYFQDQMRIDKWIVNGGLRHDKSDHQTRTGAGTTFWNLEDSKTTYNAGLGYLIDGGLMLYTNYSTSFNPVRGRTFDLIPFKPDTGKQFEVGFKYQPLNSDSLVTGSIFDLRKKNVTTADPDHLWQSVQLGEVRVLGLELEGKTSATKQLDLLASYTYLDSEITKDSTTKNIGRSTFTSKHAASVWVNYKFSQPVLQGLSASAGVRYIGKIPVYDFAQTDHISSRTLVDAALRYQVGRITYALNAANLFDKISNVGAYYNQRRFINASMNYRW